MSNSSNTFGRARPRLLARQQLEQSSLKQGVTVCLEKVNPFLLPASCLLTILAFGLFLHGLYLITSYGATVFSDRVKSTCTRCDVPGHRREPTP